MAHLIFPKWPYATWNDVETGSREIKRDVRTRSPYESFLSERTSVLITSNSMEEPRSMDAPCTPWRRRSYRPLCNWFVPWKFCTARRCRVVPNLIIPTYVSPPPPPSAVLNGPHFTLFVDKRHRCTFARHLSFCNFCVHTFRVQQT